MKIKRVSGYHVDVIEKDDSIVQSFFAHRFQLLRYLRDVESKSCKMYRVLYYSKDMEFDLCIN